MEAVPGGANYWDVGEMESSVFLICSAEDESGRIREEHIRVPIPEETMDLLEELIGDGKASITVGKEMKVSENYETVASTCWVKLTCGQTLEQVMQTREIATALALGFAEQGFLQAAYIMDGLKGRESEEPPPLELAFENEAAKEEKPTPKKENKPAGPEPGRKQNPRPRLTGKNKPNFRR